MSVLLLVMMEETQTVASAYEVAERLQADHYDRIAENYSVHYGDKYSQEYRRRFINKHLFDGIDLRGLKVLEAMCGSGETTEYLLEHRAEVTGLDVSPSEVEKFRERWPNATGSCASMFSTNLLDGSMDCVVVVGGLHHLHPHLSDAMHEIHRVLKKGGYLCFAEPHQGTVVDSLRRLWYRNDAMFASNEEAIDLKGLKAEFGEMFEQRSEVYSGNIGYLLVLNSMVFRIPLLVKKIYSPLLLRVEALIEKLQTARFSCMAIGQWRKL